jgi:pimeloyl-ACP methyl ester carboxylesterase
MSSTEQQGDDNDDTNAFWKELDGKGTLTAVVSVTPAVGVDPEVLPPNWIVSSLALASALFPKAQLPFTPLEDSAQYDCPTTSTRNFKGRWPLAISKFLLDLTSTIVPTDVEQGRLALLHIPKVIVLAGAKDVMIPLTSIQALEAKLQTPSKQVVVFPKVGHDVLSNPKSSSKALEILFGALL